MVMNFLIFGKDVRDYKCCLRNKPFLHYSSHLFSSRYVIKMGDYCSALPSKNFNYGTILKN